MSSFDLRRLRYFVVVAELGSVTRAAAELHVAQPALSHQMRLLEEEVGGELFARGPHGVRLTELGATLAKDCQPLLQEIRALRTRLTERAGEPGGPVVVGLAQTLGCVLAVPLLELAMQRFPRVQVRIRELMSSDIPDLLRTGAIDFALSYALPSVRGVRSTNVFAEDLYLFGTAAAARRFLPGARGEVAFAGMADVPLYLSARNNGFREYLESLARQRRVKLHVAAEVDSVSIRRELALSGAGFTILSGSTIANDMRRKSMFAARITQPQIRRRISFVRAGDASLSGAAQAIASLTRDAFAAVATPERWPGGVLPSAIPKIV